MTPEQLDRLIVRAVTAERERDAAVAKLDAIRAAYEKWFDTPDAEGFFAAVGAILDGPKP